MKINEGMKAGGTFGNIDLVKTNGYKVILTEHFI